jgi:hypothetical protein
VARIAPRYHPFHDLWHTFATELLLAGVPISRFSKWLGHASIQMTCDTYGHLLPCPDDLEVMEKLDRRPTTAGTTGHDLGTRPRIGATGTALRVAKAPNPLWKW